MKARCPLCHLSAGSWAGDVCPYCYPHFTAEKEAGDLPDAITNSDGLRNRGFNAWYKGKCRQLAALNEGKGDDEAEAIGYAEMEKAAKKEREGIARQQARIAKERATRNRLFRH